MSVPYVVICNITGEEEAHEEIYMHDYASLREARQALPRYFEFYNHEHPDQALDYRRPADVYFRKASAGEEAGTTC